LIERGDEQDVDYALAVLLGVQRLSILEMNLADPRLLAPRVVVPRENLADSKVQGKGIAAAAGGP